jgi:hypothetical protein
MVARNRRGWLLGAAPFALVAAVWAALPAVAGAASGRALRELKRDYGLSVGKPRVVHDGLGLGFESLAARDRTGALVLSIDRVRVHPAIARFPLSIELEGVRLDRDACAAWLGALPAGRGAWTLSRDFLKHLERALPGAHRAEVSGLVIASKVGDWRLERGSLTLAVPDPQRAEAALEGDGVTLSMELEAAQDALVATVDVAAADGSAHGEYAVPAPGWEGVIASAPRWDGAAPRERELFGF